MAVSLNRQAIEGLVARARTVKGKQFELVDEREAGLRIRAGERSATWLLCTRLRNGKRSRIKLGAWPAMGISEARHAAQAKRLEVVGGADPNEAKRQVAKDAALAAKTQRKLCDVLDDYEKRKLSQLRTSAQTRRSLDGKRGLLRSFANRDIGSITRGEIVDAVRDHAATAPSRPIGLWLVRRPSSTGVSIRRFSKPARRRRSRSRPRSAPAIVTIRSMS